MILTGQPAVDKLCEVVSSAKSFCYIITPWFGESIAQKLRKAISLSNTIIVVRDYFEGNFKTYNVLKDYNFRVDSRVHLKLIITENEYCAGSQNWTRKGIFIDHGVVTYYNHNQEDYFSYLGQALDYIKVSEPFDPKHPPIYWSEKDRPLETMPEVLVANTPPETDLVVTSDPADLPSNDIEPIEFSPPSDASKANLDDAWRLLLGKKKRTP